MSPEQFRSSRVWSTDASRYLPAAHNAILPPGTKAGWVYETSDGRSLAVVLIDDLGNPTVFPSGDKRQFYVGFAADMAFVGPDLEDIERLMILQHEWTAL